MQDYESVVEWGEHGSHINTVIEIPKGSYVKIEYERSKHYFYIDRIEPSIFPKPANYGFIPNTTDEDGDPLDTLLITSEPIPVGVVVKSRVIAVLNFVDAGENDHKIVCVPEEDRDLTAGIKDLADLDEQWRAQVVYHFTHYKDLKKPGTTNVEGWGDAQAAWDVIKDCVNRATK